MSEQDPKRLRDGGPGEGSGELRSLLDAGRTEMPSDRQMLMLAAKIGILGGLGGAGAAGAAGAGGAGAGAGAGGAAGGAGAGGAAGAAGAGAAGAGAGAGAAGAGAAGAGGAGVGVAGGKAVVGAVTAAKAGLAVKVIGAIAVASVAGAGAVAVSKSHVETSAPVGLVASEAPRASAHANAGAGATVADASVELEPTAEVDAAVKTASTASAKVVPRASAATVASADAKDEGPEAEVKLVQRAQDALRSSRPAEALALCNDHAKRFPNGMVTQECEVIAVEALVKTGRKDEARKRADRFKARFPGSAAIRRLDVLVSD